MGDEAIVRVVVVDDHEMVLESVVRLLGEDPGILVVGTALTGSGGLAVAIAERPDVVIMDYHLPDADAPDAIRALLRALPTVKVITLTGTERPGALYASIKAGSHAWVRKSRAIRELRHAVHQLAEGRPVVIDELSALPARDELVVHYQPIVELSGERIVGFEALVRWQHPERGLLYPCSFLPLAEETGLIAEIDQWAREQAASQLAVWQSRHPAMSRLWMSVNLSASDLTDPDLLPSFEAILAGAGIDPADLVVEVTESVLLEDTDDTMAFLTGIKSLGVGLALDDFGTAFSSLSYIRRFPFDRLKIDTSFTAELPHSARSMLLVESINNLAWSMGTVSIAEGIERQEQADALRGIGWPLGQGYFFSRPLPAEECESLLTDQGGWAVPRREPKRRPHGRPV